MRRSFWLRLKISVGRGTPFQFEFAGELLPFAQAAPAMPALFKLP
jgi:hypothetical protein